MSTTNGGNDNNSGGAAAPGQEIGDDLMQEVAGKLGSKLPTDQAAAPDASDDETPEETPEAKAAREQQEAAAAAGEETPEEKTAREQAEAEAAARKAETPKEKAAREQAEAAEAASNPGKADKEAAAKKLETSLKDATPEARAAAQAVIDEIIDNVVVKERAEAARLGTRVTELTTELETAQKAQGPMIVGNVNPVFMADDVRFIDEREEKIEEFERWAARAIREGGSNMPESEGYDDKKPSHTVDQIEQRLTELLQEKKKILPAARANLQKRGEIEKALRGIYPAIFDPKTAEYAQVQKVFKALPEVKQFADCYVIALKQILGDRALAELLKKPKESSPKANEKPKAATPPKATPPRAPGGGAPAKGSVLDPKSKQTAAPEAVKKVMKDPGDKSAYKAAVGALISDIL